MGDRVGGLEGSALRLAGRGLAGWGGPGLCWGLGWAGVAGLGAGMGEIEVLGLKA